jgi:hypothetical protein
VTDPVDTSVPSAYANAYLQDRLERIESSELREAQRKIRALQRELKNTKEDLKKLRDELLAATMAMADARVDEQKAHTVAEATLGDHKAQISRLEAVNDSLRERVDSLQRISLRSVVAAWMGTVLVAFGVSVITSSSYSGLGIGLIAAGAALEALAYFIGTAGRSSRRRNA